MLRKFVMSLTVLASTIVAASAASAAPVSLAISLPEAAPQVQTVQYSENWRGREWRRHERWAREHRREEWRRAHYQRG